MTLRTFLYATDALRLEEGISWTITPQRGGPSVPRVPSADAQKAQNVQSMTAFKDMMKNVQKRGKR